MTEEGYRNDAMTIGTSQVVVAQKIATGQRKVIVLTNVSTGGQRISIAINGTAVDNSSIALAAGASWVESLDAGYTPTNEQITAISSAAGGILAIHERVVGGL